MNRTSIHRRCGLRAAFRGHEIGDRHLCYEFGDGPVSASSAAPASLDVLLAHLFTSRFAHTCAHRLLRQRFPMTLPGGVDWSPVAAASLLSASAPLATEFSVRACELTRVPSRGIFDVHSDLILRRPENRIPPIDPRLANRTSDSHGRSPVRNSIVRRSAT
jgi:hypothetical protein